MIEWYFNSVSEEVGFLIWLFEIVFNIKIDSWKFYNKFF